MSPEWVTAVPEATFTIAVVDFANATGLR